MNKDQIKGALKEVAGETQEHVGRLVGNKTLEARGHALEMEGKAQQDVGNAKKAIADAVKGLSDKTRKVTH